MGDDPLTILESICDISLSHSRLELCLDCGRLQDSRVASKNIPDSGPKFRAWGLSPSMLSLLLWLGRKRESTSFSNKGAQVDKPLMGPTQFSTKEIRKANPGENTKERPTRTRLPSSNQIFTNKPLALLFSQTLQNITLLKAQNIRETKKMIYICNHIYIYIYVYVFICLFSSASTQSPTPTSSAGRLAPGKVHGAPLPGLALGAQHRGLAGRGRSLDASVCGRSLRVHGSTGPVWFFAEAPSDKKILETFWGN